MKIVISSGHGRLVSGAVGYINEVNEARKVVPKVAEYLRKCGVDVVEYHDNTGTTTAQVINNIVNYHNAQTRDYDVSVHFNAQAAPKKDVPIGVEVLYYDAEALASKVSKAIADISGLKNRGAKKRTDLMFLNSTKKPAILIEVCFVDSSEDVRLYQASFDGICRAIAEALSGKSVNTAPSTPATAANPIMGKSVLTAEQMSTFLLSKNPAPLIKCTPLELAKLYLSESNIEGVRGDVAFAQAIQETGWFRFGNDVLPEQNNYCGYGAMNTTAKGKGAWFASPQAGVRCHIQHLKAYGSKDALVNPLVQPVPPVENRFKYVTRGIAPSWADLNGRWAVPGDGYGQKILQIYADMTAFKAPAASAAIAAKDKVKVLNAVTYDGGTFRLYYSVYDVLSINGDRVVIGIGSTVTAAVNIKNLQKA